MQAIFKRYEIKYLITTKQKQEILETIAHYMELDKYGKTTIRNIYFDTDNFRLIRRSIEKPIYKEKLRIRSYKLISNNDLVFVELKKKYKGTVYKRRLALEEEKVMEAFKNKAPLPLDTQIAKEIDYFKNYYKELKPQVFLSYDREAYYAFDDSDLRITFDENILYRTTDLSLTIDAKGKPLLNDGYSLMEIKTANAIPIWLSNKLTNLKIFKTSFSKYGKAYEDIILKTKKE